MSIRHGLKWGASLLVALTLAACSTAQTTSSAQALSEVSSEPIKVLAPAGAPALATLGLGDLAEVEYVEGQDLLVSELSKADSEYDLIVAPINLGVKTWKESQAYQLDSVLTWGNLYIVSQDENWNEAGKTIAAFGEKAVPGMVFNSLYPDMQATIEYYPSVVEASAALLSQKADSALLAQPAAAGAVAKAKENGTELSLVADLQALWSESFESEHKGYPQAALFVKKDQAAKYQDELDAMHRYLESATPETIEADVEAKVDQLGVPNAKIAAATWQQQNLHMVKASEVETEIADFLSLFGIEIPEGMIVQ
ncbi:hypothetical protein [Allobaculum stercoricanis]|uniref:hypothetical protein n=1 Tax=Allobaculum stercoricanis TaxID=174709 RepID=UPI00248ECFFE|nr:hypothetical protein [Allobaculum stercoricanis]